MAIVASQLTAGQLDILTVPADTQYAITTIMVCNQHPSTNAQFDLHFIPNGSALSNAVTRVVNNLDLAAGETFTFDTEKMVLEAGDKVSFVADTNLSAVVGYLEI